MKLRYIFVFVLLFSLLKANTLFDTIDPVDYLRGKYSPAKYPKFFIQIPKNQCSKKTYLRRDVYNAYNKMYLAAKNDGIKLYILSGFRSFNHQANIWNQKAKRFSENLPNKIEVVREVLKFSAMPGTSRHHWGTEVDLNSLQNSYFLKGYGKKVYDWLMINGPTYGFYKTYTSGREVGYSEEKWHFSYIPVAKQLHKKYLELIKPYNITGFTGDEYVSQLFIIDFYVNGINKKLLP